MWLLQDAGGARSARSCFCVSYKAAKISLLVKEIAFNVSADRRIIIMLNFTFLLKINQNLPLIVLLNSWFRGSA